MHYCTQCGANATGARYCGQCGAQVESDHYSWMPRQDPRQPASEGFNENEIGAVAYLTPIPALVLLIFEPYRSNRFIRFHSYQCLFLTLAAIVLAAALALGGILLSVVAAVFSIFGFLGGLVSGAIQLALLVAWAFAAYRAWQGDEYRLPLVGGLASHHAFET